MYQPRHFVSWSPLYVPTRTIRDTSDATCCVSFAFLEFFPAAIFKSHSRAATQETWRGFLANKNACLVLLPRREALACPNTKEKTRTRKTEQTACVTSPNCARILETAKFLFERRLRVYAKIIIALSGFLPRIGLSPARPRGPRERLYYSKNQGGEFAATKVKLADGTSASAEATKKNAPQRKVGARRRM